MAERIRAGLAQSSDPASAVRLLALGVADAVEQSGFSAGGPLMMLAAESAVCSERLNAACREAYSLLTAVFAEKLAGNAVLAQFVLCTLEGAILLSRVRHSGDPLRGAAEQLESCIRKEMSK